MGVFHPAGRSYGLGVAVEHLHLPDDVSAICVGKSTYARCGIIANVTPAEAGWKGYLTLEFSNSSAADCRIYAGEGVVQMIFLRGERCRTSYSARTGKYQDHPPASPCRGSDGRAFRSRARRSKRF
jgi:dCTP deaminase